MTTSNRQLTLSCTRCGHVDKFTGHPADTLITVLGGRVRLRESHLQLYNYEAGLDFCHACPQNVSLPPEDRHTLRPIDHHRPKHVE